MIKINETSLQRSLIFLFFQLFDFQSELTERENLIEQLTESLQQSLQMREQLQTQGEQLNDEVMQLRKQLAEMLEMVKRPHWMPDQESVGQRISEISIDLVSEDDESVPDGATNQRKSNRNSTERQLDELFDQQISQPLSKDIETFLNYLSPEEMRVFHAVQKKFDDFLCEELDKVKSKYGDELKIVNDRLESEKNERETEVGRLRQLLANVKSGSTEIMELRQELEAKHAIEMENLRTYFERKCADLEKQYSEEVFSQQSRRHSNDSGSDVSDQENLPVEGSPVKKVKKDEIFASPTHRKITPTTINDGSPRKIVTPLRSVGSMGDDHRGDDDQDPIPSIDELKSFYQDKINEINRSHEMTVKRLQQRIRKYETPQNADDEFIVSWNNPCFVFVYFLLLFFCCFFVFYN